jgi:hypothetical protein
MSTILMDLSCAWFSDMRCCIHILWYGGYCSWDQRSIWIWSEWLVSVERVHCCSLLVPVYMIVCNLTSIPLTDPLTNTALSSRQKWLIWWQRPIVEACKAETAIEWTNDDNVINILSSLVTLENLHTWKKKDEGLAHIVYWQTFGSMSNAHL